MRKHGNAIEKATFRNSCKPRSEPYWHSLGTGRAIGFRKSAVGPGAWVARWTEPAQRTDAQRRLYQQKVIGSPADQPYAGAIALAQEFFTEAERDWKNEMRGTVTATCETVGDAIRLYLANMKAEKGEVVSKRTAALLKPVTLNDIPLRELESLHVERWRNSLVTPTRKKNTANRIYRQFCAAMNYAKRRGLVDTDKAWASVGQFPVRDGRRNSYLSLEQRRALIATCDRPKTVEELEADKRNMPFCNAALGDLLRGMYFTGARPGELAKTRVRDLNLLEARLTLISAKNKKGEERPRQFYLYEPAAYAFFKQLTVDRKPDDFLFRHADGSQWFRHQWARGHRAAVKLAGLPSDTVTYTARHTVITDMLSEDGIDSVAVEETLGTSAAMIKQNYYKIVREKLQQKLAQRNSL